MNENRMTLLYMSSRGIENYIARHPVSWRSQEMAKRNGVGDVAGMPPTPATYEFFSLNALKQGLFTQREYQDYAFDQWDTWIQSKTLEEREGVSAKLYCNFYPSLVSTLHAWALLVEAGWFDLCVIDTIADVCSKHDLIVSLSGGLPIALDLFIGTLKAIRDREYKQAHRKASRDFVCDSIEVPLTMDRPKKRPGNMRFYCLKDFQEVYSRILKSGSLWDTPFVPCTCGYHENIPPNMLSLIKQKNLNLKLEIDHD